MSLNELEKISAGAIARGSKTFTFASRFFGAEKMRDAALLYHWCRNCDDTVDQPATEEERLAGAARLREDLARVIKTGEAEDGPSRALAHLIKKYRIPAHYPAELIEGMAMDAVHRPPETLRELELYCYRVAGVVGLMMAHVMGVSDERALRNACDLGMAMQLTNIARDVLTDKQMGRCYLPREVLERHGLNFENFAAIENRAALARSVDELLNTAQKYYVSGQAGAPYLSQRSSFVILIARFAYARIGDKVRTHGPRAWDRRQITSKFEKSVSFFRAGAVWLRQLFRRPKWAPVSIQTVWRFP